MRYWVLAFVFSVAGAAAQAQPVPNYGFEWRTVGVPGNAPLMPGPDYNLDRPIGGVDYEYRMARTEVTNAQYLEFLVALTTAIPSYTTNNSFKGADMYRTQGQFFIDEGFENVGVRVGFNAAAMYCNWLHNDKRSDADAFTSGAYDASTFYPNPGPQQAVHSPGARFWVASRDEWTKAMHFDPNKNGIGQAGYWLYPTSSDTPPIGGLPETPGAQTGAGDYSSGILRPYPVGSYPNGQSPWGMFDGSGGVKEWCEGVVEGTDYFRQVRGTNNYAFDLAIEDRIDVRLEAEFRVPFAGIRLASVVPAPSGVITLCLLLGFCTRRRKS